MNSLISKIKCSQCSGIAKYTCPRCQLRSCSLPCVQAHKDLTSCTGIRDKTAYVCIKDFDNIHLLSDYRFLEDASRLATNAFRNKDIKRFDLAQRKSLPHWLHRLRVEAKLRGTTLKLMPHIFARRKENSTCYFHKLRKIFWHVEWQFPQVSAKYLDHRVPEDSRLGTVLGKHLSSEETYSSLTFYHACGMSGLKVLLKVEDQPHSSPKYYDVDLEDTLKVVLSRKTVIEFPVFLVILKEHIHCYDLMADIEVDFLLATTERQENLKQSTSRAELASAP